MDRVGERLAEIFPPDADVADVPRAIVAVVDTPAGQRPLRVHVDPTRDGSEVVSAVADRIRVDFFRRVGLEDLLPPAASL